MSKVISNKTVAKIKINDLISYGRKEITTRDKLEKFPVGSLISYTNKSGTFKHGGYLCKVKEDWFIYVTLDFSQKIRARYANIDKMWVGDVYKVIGDTISLNKPEVTTNYPVEINNKIVYFGKNLNDAKRFKVTNKYENMIKWFEYFHND